MIVADVMAEARLRCGESLVWVKVPSFNADAVITAHYGITGCLPPAVTASDVWSADYVGVWHMKESGVPLAESSGVSTPIDTAVAAVEFGYAGAIGAAVDMSKVTGGWANKMSAADDDDLDGFTAFTLEIWTKQDEWSSSVNYPLIEKRPTRGLGEGKSYYWYENKDKGGAAGAKAGFATYSEVRENVIGMRFIVR